MTVPKQKHTKGKRDRRRANIFLRAPRLGVCPKCGKPVLPHTACLNCGYYKTMEVIDVLKDLTKKERKQKEKEITAQETAGKEVEKKPLGWEELSKK